MWLTDWVFGLIDKRITQMRLEIVSLNSALSAAEQQNATLQAKVDAEVANSAALKAALNAAIQGQLSPEEVAALQDATSRVAALGDADQAAAQKLADSTTVNSPSN